MSANSGWEKVGGGGKSKSGPSKNGAKFTKTEKKKFAETAPKLEDVLSIDQISSVYSSVQPVKQKQSTESPKPAKNKNNNASNGNSKKQQAEAKKKEEKKPATIEEAVKKVSVPELKNLLETVRNRYPESPVLWLRDAAAYFNLALATDQPIQLAGKAFSEKPLSLLTKETRKTLTLLLEEISEAGRQSGFEALLANMTHEMAKDLSANGYLVLLQLMSEIYPTLATFNMGRYNELRNSYQNRTSIGTAMLWALGQGGRKDLSVGISVWIEFMLPMLTMKNYSRYVVEYLSGLLSHHSARIKASKTKLLYSRQFFLLFDAIFTSVNLSKESQAELLRQYDTIKAISVGDCSDSHEVFPEFLRRLQSLTSGEQQWHPSARAEMMRALAESAANNEACLKHWQQMYITYLPASAQILTHINNEWATWRYKLKSNARFRETLTAFVEYNESTSGNKPGMEQACQALESIETKLGRAGSGGGGGFRWKLNSFLLLCAIAFLVNRDVDKHGSFKASKSGVFLQDVGLYEPALRSYDFALKSCDSGYKWAEKKNIPAHFNDAKKKAQPYMDKAVETALNGLDFVKTKFAEVQAKVDNKYPTLRKDAEQKAMEIFEKAQALLAWAWDSAVAGGKALGGLARDVKDGKITMDDVNQYGSKMWKLSAARAAISYEMTSDFVRHTIVYCQKQLEVMTK